MSKAKVISIRLRGKTPYEKQVAAIYEEVKKEAKKKKIPINEFMCRLIVLGFLNYMAEKIVLEQLKKQEQENNNSQENLDK